MNELVELIVKKTGISESTATTIVNLVVNYVSKKLPAPIGSQVTALLNNEAAINEAETLIGDLASAIEKNAKNKKK